MFLVLQASLSKSVHLFETQGRLICTDFGFAYLYFYFSFYSVGFFYLPFEPELSPAKDYSSSHRIFAGA